MMRLGRQRGDSSIFGSHLKTVWDMGAAAGPKLATGRYFRETIMRTSKEIIDLE